jgi:flavin-dependent dehydrogenase
VDECCLCEVHVATLGPSGRRRLEEIWRRAGDLGAPNSTGSPDLLHVTAAASADDADMNDTQHSSDNTNSSPDTAGTAADLQITADVVVVGSRVAGASTAMLLARAGHDVVLVDRARFPSDTLSTHAISRSGVVQLQRWGLLEQVHRAGAPEIRQVSFHRDGQRVVRSVKERAGVDHLVAPRRHSLDPILVSAAEEAGARMYEGMSVRGVRRDDAGRVAGVDAADQDGRPVSIAATHVVGADGVRSTIAREVGATVIEQRPSTAGTHYLYVSGLDAVGFEYHVASGSFAGVFSTNDGEACVWLCCPADETNAMRAERDDRVGAFCDLLEVTSPELVERVRAAEVTSPVRGALRFPNHIRAATGAGSWLVGDAGYHRDPVSGHGISDALRDAELLASSIDAALRGGDELDARVVYECRRQAAIRPIFDVACRMADFPEAGRFIELQKQLGDLIDEEARALADLEHQVWERQLAAV